MKLSKEQRAAQNADFKARLKPRLLWDSKVQGTYNRKKHGPLTERK